MNPIETLTTCSGTWRGTNTLEDPNTGKPEESASTLTLTPVVGGRFVRIDYTWGYQGKPQEGSLLVGFNPKSGEVTGHWIDSWHMGRAALACLGTASEGVISVRGSYPAPTGPDWGWRIDIVPQVDQIKVRHTNIEPDANEDLAVEAVYSPSVRFKATGSDGDTDTNALPVREIGPAVGFYKQCLGFALVEKDKTTARMKRDDVEIGLAVNGQDPEQASCWFSVSNVDALWQEFDAKGNTPGIIDEQEFDGKPYRVFFAKDPYGVCFCFTQPLA